MHEIDQTVFAEGQAIFAKEPAWHGLGKVKPYVFESKVAIEEVGLGFNVSKKPLGIVGPDGQIVGKPLRDFAATVRDDSGATLGVVGSDFQPLQNLTVFSILDQAVAEAGIKVMYESAGSLRGGRRVWALARLPEPIVVESREAGSGAIAADKVYQYFLALNGHDGYTGAQFHPTTVRVVCANTAAAAEFEAQRLRQVRFNHTKNIEDRIPDMVAAVRGTIEDLKNFGELAQVLARKVIETEQEAETFGKIINLTITDLITGTSDLSKNRRLAAYNAILGHFAGNDPFNPGEESNLWRAYNAISYWIEHESRKSKTAETRFEYLVLGVGAALKSRVFKQLLEMAPRPAYSKP